MQNPAFRLIFTSVSAYLLMLAVADDSRLDQTNLLLIMFDDLRPELSIYGREHMITPNFERLAARSVVFDNAHAQISVCNPSRDSLLTGLRPDTTGTYGFQSSFRPHLSIPTRLAYSGYDTASYGKIAHWEMEDPNVWSVEHWNDKWYDYQHFEWSIMNSSTMPDKVQPEGKFRDYIFATRTIDMLRKMNAKDKYFMLAVGFKLPHLAVHMPHKYFEMYKNKPRGWNLTTEEMRYPPSAPAISYRCCADKAVAFMEDEGAKPAWNGVQIGNINNAFTDRMHDELMLGYAAAISFMDAQLGRILDTIDELKLWNNLTVVLTADHGMHNGEKGIWEKWSMFDESTRVPLIIAHPKSPFKGQHYTGAVELIDVFPTINDILGAPKFEKSKHCKAPGKNVDFPYVVCNTFQGKSLARAVLGNVWDHSPKAKKLNAKSKQPRKSKKRSFFGGSIDGRRLRDSNFTRKHEYGSWKGSNYIDRGSYGSIDGALTTNSVQYEKKFSITQSWRCAEIGLGLANKNSHAVWNGTDLTSYSMRRGSPWIDCDKNINKPDEILSYMGYSIRTSDYRYTAWFPFDNTKAMPRIDAELFEEELYDHRNEKPSDFTHREIVNLAYSEEFRDTVAALNAQLKHFLHDEVIFRGPFK